MFKKERPILSIPTTPLERIMNLLSLLFIVLTYVYAFIMWADLPNRVPAHFNAVGEVDRWGGKGEVFALPIIETFIFVLFMILSKYPHLFNYPVEVTLENAERLYTYSKILLSTMTMIISFMFLLITYEIIQIALGNEGFGNWLMPTFLCFIFGTIGYFFYRSFKLR